MENLESIKIELLPRSKIFFDSIESQLIYREKHFNKYRNLNFVASLSLLLFFTNALPIVPYIAGKNSWLTTRNFSFFSLTFPLDNFIVRWILFTALTGIIFLIILAINNHFDKKEDRLSLSNKHANFAFLYKAIKELDIFLINERTELILNSIKYIDKYLMRSFIYSSIKISDETREIYLPRILNQLKDKNEWIKYSNSTQKTIDAFLQFKDKIKERILQKTEIDLVINALNDILIFEYLQLDKVKNEQPTSFTTDPKLIANLFLESASTKILSLKNLEPIKEEINTKSIIDKLLKITNTISDLFTHRNIVITFLSWLILLSIIFSALLYLGTKSYDLKIDSTIFIGAITGIIIGEITISATIYSKK